jgi:AraC-like DNA-binding protein
VTTEAVAARIGYLSASAFRRVFAARMGMTAAQWRRSPVTASTAFLTPRDLSLSGSFLSDGGLETGVGSAYSRAF